MDRQETYAVVGGSVIVVLSVLLFAYFTLKKTAPVAPQIIYTSMPPTNSTSSTDAVTFTGPQPINFY